MKYVPDIIYDARNRLALDLYLPDDLRSEACIIYAHGGGFARGGRDSAEVSHFAHLFTRAGFAFASISYRLKTPISAFGNRDAQFIQSYMRRCEKLDLGLAPQLYGPAFIAATEDLSRAIEFLWVEGKKLGLRSRKIGILGHSSGAIAAMAVAYPPMQWADRVARPDAVVSIAGAVVQPWRLDDSGPPCLMLHGEGDRIVPLETVELAALRAEQVSAPVHLIRTGIRGHATQVDAVLDGHDRKGRPFMQMVLGQFEILLPELCIGE